MYDRIAPEEPTNAPVMISALFSRVNPIPAAAHPEYELREANGKRKAEVCDLSEYVF
jgi:hypothetical protein